MRKCLRIFFTVIFVFLSIFVLTQNHRVSAEECGDIHCSDADDREACIKRKISVCEQSVENTRNQASTLQNAINSINNQIVVQELRIEQTLVEIDQLETEIIELEDRIEGLGTSLDGLARILIERIRSSYKEKRMGESSLSILVSGSIYKSSQVQKYIQNAELQTAQTMQMAEYQRQNYDLQKKHKELKQKELEATRKVLKQQQASLANTRASKQQLLTQTQNDEARYQALLSEAIKELSSLKSYVKSQVGSATCMASSPSKGKDGIYFSQRDPRWCKQKIGNSSEILGEVGCLISSASMLLKHNGVDTSPSQLAYNTSYFSLNTAMLLRSQSLFSGMKYEFHGRNFSVLDSELEADRPVIVHLNIGTADGHFIVLVDKKDGEYIMNDPLFGPDLDFNDRYSTNMITDVRTIKPI